MVSGFKQGCTVSCDEFQINLTCHNLSSALARPEIVSDKIAKELLGVALQDLSMSLRFQIFTFLHWACAQRRTPTNCV